MIALVFLFIAIWFTSVRFYDWWHGYGDLF